MSFFSNRRYGVVGERFVWEGGSRAAPYQGVYAVMYNVPQLLAQALDFAVRGMIDRMADLGKIIITFEKCKRYDHDAVLITRSNDTE